MHQSSHITHWNTQEIPLISEHVVREQEDWSFSHLTPTHTLWGPHGYHRYPAKFIPQLVRRIIDEYSLPGECVGDPFLGSATTGIEALRANRIFFGSDIHPVALLISKAKCIPLEPEYLCNAWSQLKCAINTFPAVTRSTLTLEEKEFITTLPIAHASAEERLHYWFPAPHRTVLMLILEHICTFSDDKLRTFFLCAFSNILRNCSIWLSGSTKPQKDIRKTLGNPVEEFSRQVHSMLKRNTLYWQDLQLRQASVEDIRQRLHIVQEDVRHLSLPDETLDLLVTSPPYATCYEYSEMHQLTQLWFEKYNIFQHSTLNYIGTKSMSKRPMVGEESISTGSSSADGTLLQLQLLAQGKVAGNIRQEAKALRCYFQDMRSTLAECVRIVKLQKRMVLIIGDSYRRGIPIPTSQALSELAEQVGFALEKRIVRRIPGRVLVSTRDKQTGRFSSVARSDITAYPEENILIFQRRF